MAFKQGNLAMRLLLSLVISLLLLGSSTAHAQSASGGELAMAGEFHADSVSVKSGEVWLGLYRVGDDYELRSTTLVVNERRDDLMRMDFKEVQTNQPSEPLFLVRGLEELQPGKVEAIIQDWKFLYPGQMIYFGYGRTGYVLGAAGEANDSNPYEMGISKYKLTLSSRQLKRSQTLLDFNNGLDDAAPRVIWVGDLDRDGKADLFMEMNRHYASIGYALFLSSAATEGEFVGKVATWRAAVD